MNRLARELYECDKKRYGENGPERYVKMLLFFMRSANAENRRIKKAFFGAIYRYISKKHGIEVAYSTAIGRGLYIGHPYNITINASASIGENVNIHKGVTIGQENRGVRKGTPTIGNCVWIGINATVVGRVVIGNDVLIAPNAYVNCDVPSHSIVLGNPCKIVSKSVATEAYINNIQ